MRILSKNWKAALAAGSVLSLVASNALAHPGEMGHVHDSMFMAGLMHPLTGVDHLLAMLAVGLWSALSHQNMRQVIAAPAVFLVMLLAGAVMGMMGVHLTMVEPMIMTSLLILGLLVAARKVVSHTLGLALVGLFAVFHGLAHGMELPAGSSAIPFIAGFMLSTLGLHIAGIIGGMQLKRHSVWFSRMLGGGIAAYGVLLLAGA